MPETHSVRDIGAEMARLRAQFGLSQQEVSDRLHIRARYVSAIEEARYDQLPGKVYARGYVHTYAEFLGLDAEKIVNLCFAAEGAVSSAIVHRPPPSVRPTLPLDSGRFRGAGMLAGAVLVVALVVSQFVGREHAVEREEATVAPVPEEMLSSVRNLVMPTPGNLECLTGEALLACYFADRMTTEIAATWTQPFYFAPGLDVTGMELPEPVAAAASEPPAPAQEAPND